MVSCLLRSSWLFVAIFFITESHGQSSGSNVPNDPLWPLFAELLSSQTRRTVQDINFLGLNDPTISTMWATYQASMPKLNPSTSSTGSSPSTSDLSQPAYSIDSQPGATTGTSTNTVTDTATPTNYQDLLSMYNNIMATGGVGASATSAGSSPSYNDLVSQYNNIMAQSAPAQTPPSSSPSPMTQIMDAYNQLMGGQTQTQMQTQMQTQTYPMQTQTSPIQTQTYPMQTQTSPIQTQTYPMQTQTSPMQTQTSPMQTQTSPMQTQTSPMTDLMNMYSQMLSGGQNMGGMGASPYTFPSGDTTSSNTVNPLMQMMGSSGTGSTGTSGLDQIMAWYQQMMGAWPTPSAVQASGTSTTSTSGASVSGGSTGGNVDVSGTTSVGTTTLAGGSATNTQTAPSPSASASTASSSSSSSSGSTVTTAPTPTLSSFDQQLVELFPQFRDAILPASSSSSSSSSASSSSVTTPPPSASASASSSTSSNSSDISNTNSAQQVFDVLLFGGGTSPGQTAVAGTSGSASTATATGPSTGTNTAGPQSPLDTFVQTKNKMLEKSPGKLLSAHVQNVWKTRASREMGCRFLPELLDMDILPTMPVDCRNKCPFPYINPQRFGVYCVCCPPGVNDKVVSALSMLKRPTFMNDNPLAVVA